MNKKTKVVIGSRGSDLALWQANFIKKELERKNRNIVVDI
ncbi:MAG: hydroxymethylbilane synthase, partial [Bacteroidetes bacterium]|nr:hydroxymethylbilane synthase [Bacteroidota bacterium]